MFLCFHDCIIKPLLSVQLDIHFGTVVLLFILTELSTCYKLSINGARRWLTLATRLLRVYIGSPSPTAELTELVEFLMGHYIPMWFHIRANSTCTNGALNVMRSIELMRKLPGRLQDIIRPVVQRNAYWAHPEAVLLAMVADPDAAVRTRAVERIQRCRIQQPQEGVRPFKLPAINFAATHYTELLDWEKELVTEPPLTADLTDADLQDICDHPLQVAAFPVHTVAVERAVKVVTEAAAAVLGEERRHGWICSRLEHRRQLPNIASKHTFVWSA